MGRIIQQIILISFGHKRKRELFEIDAEGARKEEQMKDKNEIK